MESWYKVIMKCKKNTNSAMLLGESRKKWRIFKKRRKLAWPACRNEVLTALSNDAERHQNFVGDKWTATESFSNTE